MTLQLSQEQFRELMSNAEFRAEFAKEQARLAHEAIVEELGGSVGRRFPLPVSLASRVSGFNEKWIRRNVPIIDAEGQVDSVEFGDLIEVIEQRKTIKG